MPEEVTKQNNLEEIQESISGVMGDVILAHAWLQERWDGTLHELAHVMPHLTKTVNDVYDALERIGDLVSVEMDRQ